MKAFIDTVKMIQRWRPQILNFFECGITNGVTEGINNKIKAIKRACYGRLRFANLKARILYNCRGIGRKQLE